VVPPELTCWRLRIRLPSRRSVSSFSPAGGDPRIEIGAPAGPLHFEAAV
jgi:hypothetical protein